MDVPTLLAMMCDKSGRVLRHCRAQQRSVKELGGGALHDSWIGCESHRTPVRATLNLQRRSRTSAEVVQKDVPLGKHHTHGIIETAVMLGRDQHQQKG